MSDQLIAAFVIFVFVVIATLFSGYQFKQQEQELHIINTVVQAQAAKSHPPPAPAPLFPAREILIPTPEERALARETAINLTLRTFDAKTRDVTTYLANKSLARSTKKLAQAKAEQEYWKYYENWKHIAAKQNAAQIESLPNLHNLLEDFATPAWEQEQEGSNIAWLAESREGAESRRGRNELGTGVPWIPETERDSYPVLVGGRRGQAGRYPGFVDKVNDWIRNLPNEEARDDERGGWEDDGRSHLTF